MQILAHTYNALISNQLIMRSKIYWWHTVDGVCEQLRVVVKGCIHVGVDNTF
ncbi:hypothetical protein IM043_gp239 [Bacillus phage SPG24]|uniref:hypothetical protein n=1 Tax=Bacillus phage SPG24 TaxID=1497851 RepID=UPI0022BA714C|nr:hypothetical protein IM043_gp239 [Bacillus phage SPG24]